MGKRKICFVSGKRGGFGVLLPTMKKIEEDADLELALVVTDMHLSDQFGRTVEEVHNWFNVTKEVDIVHSTEDTRTDRARALGRCLTGMVDAFEEIEPDIVLLYGDRGEILASALAAVNLSIPIAHIQGGEITGGLDELFRHALTKLSHLHLVSTEKSAERITLMGEEPWRVHVVGQPHLDLILSKLYTPTDEIISKYGINPGEKLIILLQHPVSTEPAKSYEQMCQTLEAIEKLKCQTVLIYPCSDQGYMGIIRAIEEKGNLPFIKKYKNLKFSDFLGLLSIADVFVGNSSSAIIEAPYFNLPSVNIGKRQIGREHVENVIHVGNDSKLILKAIEKALYDSSFHKVVQDASKPFGDGQTCDKVVKILKEVEINGKLVEKCMTY